MRLAFNFASGSADADEALLGPFLNCKTLSPSQSLYAFSFQSQMDTNLDYSYASLYSPTSHALPKRSRSRFVTTLKHVVYRSTNKPPTLSRSSTAPNKVSSKNLTRSWDSWHITWKRRGQTPGMDDYLTLEQLENVWYKQDFYVGCISVPQKVTQYTFTEAVEAPLIAEHNVSARRQQESQPLPNLENFLPNNPSSHDTIIDGAIHPALRPVPYLKDLPTLTPEAATSHRLVVSVPDTHWTYGRD